ncbi:MAG TPA: recombinase family protein, partial [Thermoanaerobaculia bacterium]|nr:recombinase family protein [Thermoanaerobaculia bacterium]
AAGHQETDLLANLRAYATRRGWEVVLECADPAPGQEGAGKGLRSLKDAVRTRAIQGVLVTTLSHLARSLRHLTELGQLFAAHDVALVALEEEIDTTEPGGAIRWRDWLEISTRLNRQVRSEGAKLARLRPSGHTWGRPVAVVNPLELLAWWEGRGGRPALSLREIARKLGVSEATARKRLHELRVTGQVNDQARTRSLATRRPLRRGGHPARPIDDDALRAEWEQARRRGTPPSITTIARTLRVSRSRVRTRLQEIGLLDGSTAIFPEQRT